MDPAINPTLPGYRRPDPLPAFRIKDTFLWNLHEALATPEEFAVGFVRDLDLPNPQGMTLAISNQIRQQLEEYAGVALHPLFQSTQIQPPAPQIGQSRDVSTTPAPTNLPATPEITATKEPLVNDSILNPDDAYRCMINLNINLQNKLYTDKFEWSLLHPPGMADDFAKVTCADLGLNGEWVGAIAHGIYEAVLKLKKEVCESGGLISGYGNEIDNQAANGAEAGWRYDPEGLGDEWEPKVETLSKEEIERREGDRERQIRRLRRETARFSSTAGITPDASRQGSGYFDVDGETPLGRGERNKRKKRFRSLSPSGRPGTPGGRGTPDTGSGAGYGGGGGTLSDWLVTCEDAITVVLTANHLYFMQGATKLAVQQLHGMGYRCLGRTRWSRRLKGKQPPTFSGISSSRLTKSRTCATIVVFCTNATRSFPNGRKTFIATTSPLVGRGHPGSLLANRTPSKALQRRESATCTKLEQQNVLALAYDALTLARYLCKSLYLVTIIITNHISLNVAMTFFFSYLPNEPLTDRIGAFDGFLFFFSPVSCYSITSHILEELGG